MGGRDARASREGHAVARAERETRRVECERATDHAQDDGLLLRRQIQARPRPAARPLRALSEERLGRRPEGDRRREPVADGREPADGENDASVRWYGKADVEQGKLEEAPSPDFEEGGNPLALLEAMALAEDQDVSDEAPRLDNAGAEALVRLVR